MRGHRSVGGDLSLNFPLFMAKQHQALAPSISDHFYRCLDKWGRGTIDIVPVTRRTPWDLNPGLWDATPPPAQESGPMPFVSRAHVSTGAAGEAGGPECNAREDRPAQEFSVCAGSGPHGEGVCKPFAGGRARDDDGLSRCVSLP